MEMDFNSIENNTGIGDSDSVQSKCKNCGGVMRFSPSGGCLKCIYCGCEEALDTSAVKIETSSYEEWKAVKESDDEKMLGETESVPEVRCNMCSAMVTFPNNVSTMKCPFCGTSLVLSDEKIEKFWKPQGILPFKIEQKECKLAYSKWLKGKWFAPGKLKKELAETSVFKGVYIPYWAYDADSYTEYVGERGNRYTETVERNGKNVRETRVEWTMAEGSVNVSFDNVLVAATDTIPVQVRAELNEWDLENSVVYSKEFTSGFVTELYKRDFVECIDVANEYMESEIESKIKRDIGGDLQRIRYKDISYNNVMFKLMLLPIWISSYNYKDKVYRLIVNG
jgi:hypothetical protein